MEQLRFSNKGATVAATVFTIAGTILSLLLLENSLKGGFNWYEFLPAVCYLICLGSLAGYAFSKEMKTTVAFRTVLACYAFVLLVTGIIMPPVFPYGTKPLFIAFAVIIIMSFFLVDRFWNKLKLTGVILLIALSLELISAISALAGNPMMGQSGLVNKCALFIRPLILAAFSICYFTRVYEKLKKIN